MKWIMIEEGKPNSPKQYIVKYSNGNAGVHSWFLNEFSCSGGIKVVEWLDETDPLPAEGLRESVVQIVHNGENKYWCKCESCGWENSSEFVNGGGAIGDTGDYSDVTCPVCGSNKLDGDSKYVTEEKYETTIVTIPINEFLIPYEKAIEKLNRLEADAYWSQHIAEGGPGVALSAPLQPVAGKSKEPDISMSGELCWRFINGHEDPEEATITKEKFLHETKIMLESINEFYANASSLRGSEWVSEGKQIWNSIVAMVGAADIVKTTIPDDVNSINQWKDNLISKLSAKYEVRQK